MKYIESGWTAGTTQIDPGEAKQKFIKKAV